MRNLVDWVAAYCISAVLLLSGMVQADRKKHLLAILILSASGVLVPAIQNQFMIVAALFFTLFYHREERDWLRGILKSFTAIILLWMQVVILSAVAILQAPDTHNSFLYNVGIGILLLAGSLAIRLRPGLLRRYMELRGRAAVLAIVMETSIILYFTLFLPRFGIQDRGRYAVILLSMVVFLLVVVLLLGYILTLEGERRERSLLEEVQRRIREQYQTAVELKHFYLNLYQGLGGFIHKDDMPGLRAYFEKYIATVHERYLGNRLEGIRNESIRILLESGATRLATVEGVELSVQIDGTIQFPPAWSLTCTAS